MKKWIAVLLLAMLLSACGSGGIAVRDTEGNITLREPWARPAKAGGNSAIYFVIDNGGEEDTLLGVACDAAMMAQVHKTTTDASGTSAMEHQPSVPVPSGQKVTFEPGGLHVMLMNLKSDLEPGQKLSATLRFEKAGEIHFEASVREQ